MKNQEQDTFTLQNFEGPLDFLLHLIRKSEIDIHDIPIQELTDQYLQKLKELMLPSVDAGAEFIGTAASLIWMKSKMLLPQHEQTEEDEEIDPRFEIIHQLIEYCRFKEAAKTLSTREEKESGIFTRKVEPPPEIKTGLGVEHLALEDFTRMFQSVLNRATTRKDQIKREFWRVSDKLRQVRNLLSEKSRIPFKELFTSEKCREELIVTFLAILELMKIGEGKVMKDTESQAVVIMACEVDDG